MAVVCGGGQGSSVWGRAGGRHAFFQLNKFAFVFLILACAHFRGGVRVSVGKSACFV